jgi:hypothetical protein
MTLDAPLQSPLESRTSLRYPWTRYLDKCIRWGCGVALGIAALTQRTAFSAVTTATSERWLSLMLVPGIKSCDHRSVSAKSDHFTVSMSSEESVVRHAARTRMPHRTCGDRNLPTVQESITRTSATDAIARVWGRPRLERNTRDKPLAYGTSRRSWGKLRTCPLERQTSGTECCVYARTGKRVQFAFATSILVATGSYRVDLCVFSTDRRSRSVARPDTAYQSASTSCSSGTSLAAGGRAYFRLIIVHAL